ncbi:MAG: hypothetical protein ACHREM_20940 [Polyangiales bacterium]
MLIVVGLAMTGGCKPIDDLFADRSNDEVHAQKIAKATASANDRPPAPSALPSSVTSGIPSHLPVVVLTPSSSASGSAWPSASSSAWPFPAHSAAPTFEEWMHAGVAQRPLRVAGLSGLGCDAVTVRDWVRVTCAKGAGELGAMIREGSGAEAFTQLGEKEVSLTIRVREGARVEATFLWKGASHAFELSWAKGAPPPEPIARMMPSPLGGPVGELTCRCALTAKGEGACTPEKSGASFDCEHTYPSDCDKLLACNAGKVTALPRCEVGTALDARNRCSPI